jgi:glutamate-ammonia-ligase adenylyltransferase
MVLANAFRHPDVAEWGNSIRLLKVFEQRNLIPKSYTDILSEANMRYRKTINKLSLQEKSIYVEADAFRDLRSEVIEIWDKIMKSGS